MMLRCLVVAAVLTLVGCASAETIAENRQAARVNTQLGISYAQRGKYDVALEKLQRAIKEDDESPKAHAALAFVYQNQGDFKKAERHYRRALELDGDDPALKNNFGAFLCSQLRSEEAESYFLAAARNPRYATPEAAWTNAGVCLKNENMEKAEKYLREALRVRPDYREALAPMAVISFRLGEYMSARAFLQRYDLSKSASADLLYVAAETEKALGDDAAARRFEERLRNEFPESEEAASSNQSLQ